MVLAEDPAPPLQRVAVKLAGGLVVTRFGQAESEVIHRVQGVGVVLAEDPAPPLQRIAVKILGRLVLAQFPQVNGEVVS